MDEAGNRAEGFFLKGEIRPYLDLAFFQHIQRFGTLGGGIRHALEELQQFQGDIRIHLFRMLQVQIEIQAGVHLVHEGIQDVYFGAEGLDCSFHRDDAACQVGEEGIDLVVFLLKRIQNGIHEVAQFKVTEVRSGELAAHTFTHLQHSPVVDLSLGLRNLEDCALETVGIMQHHAGDDINQVLALL